MTFFQRAVDSANSLAADTVSTVSAVGTAVAEAAVSTTNDIRTGIRSGRVRPATVVAAAAVGAVCTVEFPVLLAAGGVALVISKLKQQHAAE